MPNLAPEQEARLRELAAHLGLTAEELLLESVTDTERGVPAPSGSLKTPAHSPEVAAIIAFAARLRAGDPEVLRIQAERNARLPELLQEWRAEPPDLEESEGYPEEITPLGLRHAPFGLGDE